jgi:beta-lactamase class A
MPIDSPLEEPVAVDDDLYTLFENEYIYIADNIDAEGHTFEEYRNNLNYFQEGLLVTVKNSREVVSLLYYDIATGYTFSYNEDVEIPTASTIKTALAIYIMDMASRGEARLDKKLTYTGSFYQGGTGIIQHQEIGTQFTIERLLELMVIESDNVAYRMLLQEFGHKNVQEYWYSLGTTTTYKSSSTWGNLTATDGLIYMKQLYRFYREHEEYGKKLMDLFKAARFRYLFARRDIEVAHKSGSTKWSQNDLSIVFHDQPFIFVVLTKKDAMLGNMTFFSKVTDDIWAFHEYFWNNISYRYLP